MLRLVLSALCVLSCGASDVVARDEPPSPLPAGFALGVREVVTGLSSPLALTAPAGDSRLFVAEQGGRIRIVANGQLLATPFLDVSSLITSGGERGLLGLAFHPSYASNGQFFVYYTDRNGDVRVMRYLASASDANRADEATATQILLVPHRFASNHNGGSLVFGPDGMLWVGIGDGGGGGDPHGNGQNRNVLLAKLLRLDVDHGSPYAIPTNNPFARGGGAPEVWAIGMRNPWRFAFDRATGLLYIGDVGQNAVEEIDVVRADAPGLNFGWNVLEGSSCYRTDGCSTAGFVLPALEYRHSQGCSVTGGYVYRGSAMPAIRGHYFYSDYCSGWLRSFRYDGSTATDRRDWDVRGLGSVLSFGEDANGELYILTSNGKVLRIVST
jgi:hypothetical protein